MKSEVDSVLANQLVRDNLLTESQLRTALEFQQSLGGDLKTILMKLGFINESMLLSVVAEQQHIHTIDLDKETVDHELMEKLGRQNVEKYQVLPIKGDASYVVLAMGDPNDFKTIETVQFLLDRKVEGVLTTRANLRRSIERYYSRRESGAVAATLPKNQLDTVRSTSTENLLRALIVSLIEGGTLDPDVFFSNLSSMG